MRIKVTDNMPLVSKVEVIFNGKLQKFVSFADDEEGYIVRAKTDEQGNVMQEDGFILYERVDGHVELRMKDDESNG